MNGFLLVDKPPLCTSFNVVSLCRKVFQLKSIGHSGTLDPFATGLLIVAIGEARKLLEYLPSEPKEYVGTAVLGATSSTYDCDGDIRPLPDAEFLSKKIDLTMINKIVQEKFTGRILQVPPSHSAVKIRGVPAYVRARRGDTFSIAPRTVTVSAFEITNFEYPYISFRVVVSSGTYIRSLFHDLGQELGVGAYLDSLRRTRIGSFSVHQALPVDELESFIMHRQKDPSSLLHPMEFAVVTLPRRELRLEEYLPLCDGLFIDALPGDYEALETEQKVLAAFLNDRLVGILEFVDSHKLKFHKKLNL